MEQSGLGQSLRAFTLERAAIVVREVSPLGATRRVVLRVAPPARWELGLTVEAARSESLPHAFWKAWHADRLRREGWEVQVEASRPGGVGGSVDILGRRGNHLLALEVETGKSDVAENVRRDLLAGVDAVLVEATDKRALLVVEQQFARAGLLGTGRVRRRTAGPGGRGHRWCCGEVAGAAWPLLQAERWITES